MRAVSAVAMLVGGLVLLTIAADRFVLAAARLSIALRVSPVIIGVIVIGFGTSLPELVVTSLAAAQGSQDIAFGNIVGSNIANVLLVLGAAALMAPIAISVVTLRREIPLMLGAVLLLTVVTIDRRATVGAGVVLLTAGALVSLLLVRSALADRTGADALSEEVGEYAGATPRLGPAWLLAVAGLTGTILGAQLLVWGAIELARLVGLSEAFIGLTVVAVGTSLPELVTAVAAARRQEADLVVGNVLGSNLFNSLPIAGVAAIIGGPQLAAGFPVALAMMLFACVLASVFLFTGRRLSRREGLSLLLLFAAAVWGISVTS